MLITRCAQWCAYSQLILVFAALVRGGSLSQQVCAGRRIALLGFFCPFFWIALFTGAEQMTVLFHAAHSGIVFMIGLVIMALGIRKVGK